MSKDQHAIDLADERWAPEEYLRFSEHRLRPALELLARIPVPAPRRIADLGCGTGNVTGMLARRWPSATLIGVDNSRDMLEKARAGMAGVAWQQADIATWQPGEPPDLIYSNAALHWINDHRRLFPRLLGYLRRGGCLAVQMPLSWDLPSHRLMREVIGDCDGLGRSLGTPELRKALGHKWVEDAAVYFDLLSSRTQGLDIWTTEYLQVLQGEDPVLQWVQSTGLRPVLHGLADDERDLFLAAYRERLRRAYPMRADGTTVYPFRRLFIVATV